MSASKIKKTSVYITEDGTQHTSYTKAQIHEGFCEAENKLTEALAPYGARINNVGMLASGLVRDGEAIDAIIAALQKSKRLIAREHAENKKEEVA